MKQFSSLQLRLLQHLADGHCHSGSVLGEQLGVSRTAIWKQISQLTDLGVGINRFPQQGYQLTQPLQLLDETLIRHHLQTKDYNKALNFHIFASADSTNRFLKDSPDSTGAITICCAEKQTQGRGRFGRTWFSPFGENIYCSSRWHLDCCLSQLSGLSLVVGLAILACLNDLNLKQDIKLKWPNDVLWQDKKLAGILIEVIGETNGSAQVIIGIGMNVNAATQEQTNEASSWCSLNDITGEYFDRNLIVAHLIYQLDCHLQQFLTQGFSSFQSAWQEVDYLYEKEINISQPTGAMAGKACGVNQLGQLCLETKDKNVHYLSSGDTSLKKLV